MVEYIERLGEEVTLESKMGNARQRTGAKGRRTVCVFLGERK